jgi:AraC-like DNA-binding protein
VSLVRTHVREHLAEPHLRVEELARRHNLSVRHVYTLFERTAPLTRKRLPARWPGAVN